MLPLPEAMGSTRNMLASLGLRWWQHTILSGVHEQRTAVEVTGPTKAVLTPSIRLCPSDPAVPFRLYRRQFQFKITFAVTVSKAQGQTLNPLNPELNPICYLLALLGAHHFLHVSRIRVKLLTFRPLMSYIYVEHPFLMFLDHTQRRSTVGRTPLDE